MRGKVREVGPGEPDPGEVFDVEPDASDVAARRRDRGAAGPGNPARAVPAAQPAIPTPAVPPDAGPNGDVVADMLRRAAAMTPADRRRLAEATGWRWGGPTPLLGVTQAPVARARAIALGRTAGRGDAIRAIDAAAASLAGADGRRSRHVSAAVAGACLAVLTRDLVEPGVFETLFGPWREVMHH